MTITQHDTTDPAGPSGRHDDHGIRLLTGLLTDNDAADALAFAAAGGSVLVAPEPDDAVAAELLSLIHISEPTRRS